MVSVVYWLPTGGLIGSSRLAATWIHSSHEPGELLQDFKHDDSTIKIILVSLLFCLSLSDC